MESAAGVNPTAMLVRREIVQALLTSPTEQIERFIATDYPRVVAAVTHITGAREAAEDAVQDAMVALLRRTDSQPLESATAWLCVVASNQARDQHRRRGAEGRATERLGLPPEEALEHDTMSVDVQRAVAQLSDRQREIVVLHYYLDRPVAEIAAALDVSEGTVKTQLHRARKALAVTLAVDDGTTDDTTGDDDSGEAIA